MKRLFFIAALLAAPLLLSAQSPTGLDPADLLKPLSNQWPSYSGDNTGKRFSALKQINTSTVKNLSLQWVNSSITTACGPTGGDSLTPLIVGGFGDGTVNSCGPTRFGGGILFVKGILYGAS